MSAQTMNEAWAPIEAKYRDKVMQATWGHLAPWKNKLYQGTIVFAVGCFGDDPLNPTAISCRFDGLDSSPWFFDAMAEFLSDQKVKPGCVYEFKGTFQNYLFEGSIRKVFDSRFYMRR